MISPCECYRFIFSPKPVFHNRYCFKFQNSHFPTSSIASTARTTSLNRPAPSTDGPAQSTNDRSPTFTCPGRHLRRSPVHQYTHFVTSVLTQSTRPSTGSVETARDILAGIDSAVPGMVSVRLRRIGLEVRSGYHSQAEALYQECLSGTISLDMRNFYAWRYARFADKVGQYSPPLPLPLSLPLPSLSLSFSLPLLLSPSPLCLSLSHSLSLLSLSLPPPLRFFKTIPGRCLS